MESGTIKQTAGKRAGYAIEQGGNTSKTIIKTGIIESAESEGIHISGGGTVIIGEELGIPSKEIPSIYGKTYGVSLGDTGKLYFYDGIIKGAEGNSIFGSVAGVESGYEIIKTITEGREEAILDRLPVAKLISTDVEYNYIQEAIDASADNTAETIELLRTVVIDNSAESILIGENKNITFDLKGYEVQASNTETFKNSGTLKILSTARTEIQGEEEAATEVIVAEQGTGSILNYTDTVITNNENAQLDVISGNIVLAISGTSSNYLKTVVNNGTITINGGSIKSSGDYVYNIYNNKDIYCNSGNIEITGGDSTINIYNSTNLCNIYINGGTINNNVSSLGSVSSDYYCILNGNIYIVDGYINMSAYACSVNSFAIKTAGIIKMSGGTVRGNGDVDKTIYLNSSNTEGIEFTGGSILNYDSYGDGIYSENTSTITVCNTVNRELYNASTGIINIGDNANIGGDRNAIKNASSGKINIIGNNITITAGSGNCVVNSAAGEITINGENINITQNSIYNDSAILNDGTGTINIQKANVNLTNSYGKYGESGVKNSDTGIINIGIDDGIADATTPIITSNTIGVTNYGGTLNFYDGAITATNEGIRGLITNIAEGYQCEYTKTETSETYTICIKEDVASITTGENTITYNTVGEAIEACADSTTTTIKLLKGIIIEHSNIITIPANKDIILDLNGKELRCHSQSNNIINNGKLEITDTYEGAVGTIYGYGSKIVENTNDLTLTLGTIAGRANENQKVIYNSGTAKFTMNGGSVYSYGHLLNELTNYAVYTLSSGAVNLNGGIINISKTEIGYSSHYESYAVYINNENAIINFNGVDVTGNANPDDYYSTDKSYGIYNIASSKITISGGTIDSGKNGIYNNSTMNVTGGTVFLNGKSRGIYNTSTGIINISGEVNIQSSKMKIENDGQIYMTGGQIQNSATEAIYNGNVLDITGGTIVSTASYGIHNKGTLILGKEEYPVSITTPSITGANNGVYVESGTFNFYDGIITGGTLAISGQVTNTPELYSIQTLDNGKIAKLAVQATFEQVATVNGIYFNSLQEAINTTTPGATVKIEKDIVLSSPATITETQDLIIDLQAHSIKYAGEDSTIINNGILTIIDSLEDGTSTTEYGSIENLDECAIQNNGTLIIGEDDTNVYTNSPRITGGTYAIDTTAGTLFSFFDGILEGITGAINGTINSITTQAGYSTKSGTRTQGEGEGAITYITNFLGT